MTLSGSGTSRTIRSIWLGSARRGTKKPLAPASANALLRSMTCSIRLSSCSLTFRRQVCPRVDEEVGAHRAPHGLDPPNLELGRVDALLADALVFEIATDSARSRQTEATLRAAFLRVVRMGALEIHRQRQVDRLDDPPALASAKSSGTCSPSSHPFASATRWLPVASAFRPGLHHGRVRCVVQILP